MKDKTTTSNSYTELQKLRHGHKPIPLPKEQVIAMTGAARASSIGEAIFNSLSPNAKDIQKINDDVRGTVFLPREANVLLMCHGVMHLDWIEDCPEAKMEEVLDVNLLSMAVLIKQFVKNSIDLPTRKQIVVIGSMAHNHVLNGSAVYCASKAGLNMLIKCLAWELAPKGFDLYCINPSNTAGTPMTEDTVRGLMRYRDLTRAEAEGYWGASNPRVDWLSPKNIADLVEFILSGKGQYLSGCNLDLAGGQR